MSDFASSNEAIQPVFNIQRIYLKDASLELPNAPQIFLETDAPAVEVQINVEDTQIYENIYEVAITVTLTTRVKDQVGFLVEAKQAGIFEIQGMAADQLAPVLGIVCPNIVYPYLRSNVSDLIGRSGFPPIHLAEINFEAYYQQRLAALAEQQQASALLGPDGLPVH
jgi:preprotein translocase subunit SecB